jgi:hypothetical protein
MHVILTNSTSLHCKIDGWDVFVYVFFVDCICDVATQYLQTGVFLFHVGQTAPDTVGTKDS